MPFTEKSTLKDERRPLLRDPVWSGTHRYGRPSRGGYDPEEMEELLGLDHARNQKFRMTLFLCVTITSVLILFLTMAVLVKLSQTHAPIAPPIHSTTPFPVSISSSSPKILSSTSAATTAAVDLTPVDANNTSVIV